MLHPLPLPLSSCLGCIPPLIGLPSLRFYAVGSSLFLLSVCFCLCSLFYRDDVLCWLLLARPFLYAFHAHLRFPVDLVWFRLSCDHGWIRSGSVNVRKQQQQPGRFWPKKEKVGVGQPNMANDTLCRYCFQVLQPFLAKKAPGAPVFGHCSSKKACLWYGIKLLLIVISI